MSDELYDYFGDPTANRDLARSDNIVEDLFIETVAVNDFLSRDPEYHVIVGSKGTEKSLLLFKKAVLATKKPGIVVAPSPPLRAYTPSFAYADSRRWIPFFRQLEDERGRPDLVQWGKLWEWALSVTVLHAWRDNASWEGEKAGLKEQVDELLSPTSEKNPFFLIASFLQGLQEGSGYSKGRPVLPDSSRLLRFMSNNLNDLPPPYLFLDNQDELFFEAPDFWKASGAGCFLALQQLNGLGNHRIHIFATMRPEILWHLSRAPEVPQWSADIQQLRWLDGELFQILTSRAKHLKEKYLRSPEYRTTDPCRAFVGEELYREQDKDLMIRVPMAELPGGKKVYQPLRDYLLRHTLRRPREMIILGNAILDGLKYRNRAADPEDVIRAAVDEKAAKVIAQGYIGEIAHRWPWGDPADVSIREFITTNIRKNLLSAGEVQSAEKTFAEQLGIKPQDVSPMTKLASFGLIGWPAAQNTGEILQHFVAPSQENVVAIPGGVEWFLVHPILYSAPFFVQPVPGLIVGPELPFPSDSEIRRLQNYTCFICCGKPDERFAKKLYEDLRRRNVECWLYVADSVPGREIWHEVKKTMKEAERWIVICSVKALVREGVCREIEEMVDIDPKRIIPVSTEEDWRRRDFKVLRGSRDLKPYLVEKNLVSMGRRGKKYSYGLERLLIALKRDIHGRWGIPEEPPDGPLLYNEPKEA